LTAAQVALEDALKNEPSNQSFKEQLAKIYTLQGKWSKAAELFTCVPDSELQVLNALYLPRPDGFQKAIEIGHRLLADERHKASADLHVWMACAYGQQYAYEKEQKAGDDELNGVKVKMLQEIEAAISADPKRKVILRSVWKPEPGSEDNDLAVFGPDDPDLKSRLE
jgi:predicted Zn-dependent protease